MGKTSVHAVDLLSKVEKDLQRLPRHEWDNYLWDLCNRFVSQRGYTDGVTSPLQHTASQQEPD